MRRRALLASAGASMAALTGGCLGTVRDALHSARLGWLGVTNYDSDPHRFRVQVRRDGELVHDSTRRIRGGSDDAGEGIECTWDEGDGPYHLMGRVDGGQWVQRSVDAALDGAPDCATARAVYDDHDSGELAFHVRAGCDRAADRERRCPSVSENS